MNDSYFVFNNIALQEREAYLYYTIRFHQSMANQLSHKWATLSWRATYTFFDTVAFFVSVLVASFIILWEAFEPSPSNFDFFGTVATLPTAPGVVAAHGRGDNGLEGVSISNIKSSPRRIGRGRVWIDLLPLDQLCHSFQILQKDITRLGHEEDAVIADNGVEHSGLMLLHCSTLTFDRVNDRGVEPFVTLAVHHVTGQVVVSFVNVPNVNFRALSAQIRVFTRSRKHQRRVPCPVVKDRSTNNVEKPKGDILIIKTDQWDTNENRLSLGSF